MKKVIAILTLVVLSLSFGVALATDGVTYRDDELGFSFVMPSDYEYYGDVLQETVELTGSNVNGIEKVLLYQGYDSNVGITYGDDIINFDGLAKGLPKEIARDEIDFYLFTKEDREVFMEELYKSVGALYEGQTIISHDFVDYGGKLSAVTFMKGRDNISGLDFYQQIAIFLNRDYVIYIGYSMLDMYGELEQEEAMNHFEQCFETLSFDIVPSDTTAKLVLGKRDRSKFIYGIIGIAIVIGIIVAITVLIRRRRNRSKIDIYRQMK